MANPTLFFEDHFSTSGATVTMTSEASGFPKENLQDWRLGTAYRWKATTVASQTYKVDAGAGTEVDADTFVIGGHNLGTVTADITIAWSTNDAAWTDVVTSAAPSDDYPYMRQWTAPGVKRYWRVIIANATTTPAQAGIITLGRRLDFTEGAQFDLDPYQHEMVVEDSANENGSPIGVNVRYKRKMFSINHTNVGMTKTDFYEPASGLGFDADFVPHALEGGKPFWFTWNWDVDTDETYLCKTRRVGMPFKGSTARRQLVSQFEAWREVA